MKKLSDYERYQLEWMISHGYSILDLIKELESYFDAETYLEKEKINLQQAFNDWELDSGFNGSIYACEEEFLSLEN